MRPVLAAAALLVLAVTAAPAADVARGGAAAADPLPSSPGIPACDDAGVLSRIVERQAWAEANTWQDGVVITAIDRIRQRYPGTQFVSAIEHRHCEARADLGGRTDRLYYVISKRTGFASIGYGVEFCLPSHDPYRVYDANCRVLW